VRPFERSWRLALGGLILSLGLWGTGYGPWVAGLVLLVLGLDFVWGVWDPKRGYFVETLNRLEPRGKELYLTFDDGPNGEETTQVLGLLEQYGAKASFFVVGQKVKDQPELVRAMVQGGHEVGNHSWSHSGWINFSNAPGWQREIAPTNQLLESLGVVPRYFRPPVGLTNPHLGAALEATGMTALGWSFRTQDWRETNLEKLVERILARVEPGAVFLLHDGPHPGVAASKVLAVLLPRLLAQGYFLTPLPH